MTDIYDRATEVEALHREAALINHADKQQNAAAVSAYECEECGTAIPEARRQAVPGCRCCIDCQQEREKHGKTRLAARRN